MVTSMLLSSRGRPTRVVVAATIVVWIVVVASGVWLIVQARPADSATAQNIEMFRDSVTSIWVQRLHLLSTIIVVLLGIVGGFQAIKTAGKRRLVALFFGSAAVSLAAAVLAFMIPWFQLVLLDFTEIESFFTVSSEFPLSFDTYRTLRSVHQLSLPILGTLTVAALAAEGLRRAAPESAGDSDADVVE